MHEEVVSGHNPGPGTSGHIDISADMADDLVLNVRVIQRYTDRFFRTPGCTPPATPARTAVDGFPLCDRYGTKDAVVETGSATNTLIVHFDRKTLDRSYNLVEILGWKVLVEAGHTAAMATKTQGQQFATIRDIEHKVVNSYFSCCRHQALCNCVLKMILCLRFGVVRERIFFVNWSCGSSDNTRRPVRLSWYTSFVGL
jgi:hypothetical protein